MDFQDYPSQPKSFPWKPVLIVGAGIVVAVGIIGGTLFFLQTRGGGPVTNGPTTQSKAAAVKENAQFSNCDAMPNPQGCRDHQTLVRAVTQKKVSECSSLSTDVKDNCIWSVASAVKDESLCKQISKSTDAVACSDGILHQKAIAASDETICDKLVSDADKKNCHNAFLMTVTAENCAARKQDPAYCEYLRVTEAAVKAHDRTICDSLKDFHVTVCRSMVFK